MSKLSGNCTIPFGFFGRDCRLDHAIVSIEMVGDDCVVTGDDRGVLIVWAVREGGAETPEMSIDIRWLLAGHRGPISGICLLGTTESSTKDKGDNASCVVTVSAGAREMAVWSCSDGRCVRFDRNVSSDHLRVTAYQPTSRASSLLLCCGKYPGIQIMDSMSLRVIVQLKSQGYPNWVQSLCAFEHQQAGVHVVLGLSVARAAILWTLDGLDNSSELRVVPETESRLLPLVAPAVEISMCPWKPRLVLVLSVGSAQIYDAASWTLLGVSEAGCDSCFTAGQFLSPGALLVHQSKSNSKKSSRRSVRLLRIPQMLLDVVDSSANRQNTNLPLQLAEDELWDSQCEIGSCFAVTNQKDQVTLATGFNDGTISVWRSHLTRGGSQNSFNSDIDTNSIPLSFSFKKQWRQKNFLSLSDPLIDRGTVTCCHYASLVNSLVFGMESGEIVVADVLQVVCATLFLKKSSFFHPQIFSGHKLPITGLYYDELKSDDKSNQKFLLSGSSDFSIRLWNFQTAACLRTFHCHTGPVKAIIKSPMLGLTKGKHDGHIKANKNKENSEQEVLKPINNDSWLGTHVFVSIDEDYGIAFLSLDTRRVVLQMKFSSEIVSLSWRKEHIVTIIECADGLVTVWELGASKMDRCESGQLAKDLLDTATDKYEFRKKSHVFPTTTASVSHRMKRQCGSCLSVQSIGPCQVLTIDTESVLVDLYQSQSEHGGPSRAFIETQVLLCLLNQWGIDPRLDKTLESSLGLLSIPGSISCGHIGTRFDTVSFPLSACIDLSENPIYSCQKLLSAVSLCHVLNNFPEKHPAPQFSWLKLIDYLNDTVSLSKLEKRPSIDHRTTMRQVFCLYATSLVTFSLPRLLSRSDSSWFNVAHIQLILQQFLQKYQDRCLEIREAARTLFHASMDCLTNPQRSEVVQSWVIQSRIFDFTDESVTPSEKLRSSFSSTLDIPSIGDWKSSWSLAEMYEPGEIEKMQVVAVAFLAAVGSRSNRGGSPVSGDSGKTIPGFAIEDYRLARITCGHLMRLLCQQTPGVVWPEIRRLAITLLGQGFPVWEPYLEVGAFFGKLLEIAAGAEKLLTSVTPGQLLSDEIDACRSARIALQAVALSRPKVFATVLSREVLRLQTQTQTAVQVSNGSIPTSKIIPAVQNPPNQTQPPLLAARHEVIEVIKVLCERKTREMHEVFPEIMDVLLACLNKLELRQYDLQQLFPPILLFRIASSHTASGKICVGTRSGHVAFYDVKLGKYNTSSGHKSAVTSVTFSPDGKQVASYSMPDNSVCIWQLFSSGLFGMGSSHQVKLASCLNVPPVTVSKTVSEEDSGLLLWLEWYESKSIHLVTNSGLVNKIKL